MVFWLLVTLVCLTVMALAGLFWRRRVVREHAVWIPSPEQQIRMQTEATLWAMLDAAESEPPIRVVCQQEVIRW